MLLDIDAQTEKARDRMLEQDPGNYLNTQVELNPSILNLMDVVRGKGLTTVGNS